MPRRCSTRRELKAAATVGLLIGKLEQINDLVVEVIAPAKVWLIPPKTLAQHDRASRASAKSALFDAINLGYRALQELGR